MRKGLLVLILTFLAVAVLVITGCGGGGSSSTPNGSGGVAKVTISGTVSFPSINSIVAKQAAAITGPTVEIRSINGAPVASASVTGSGTVGDPYKYSTIGLDSGSDYVVKVTNGSQVMKALIDKASLNTTTIRNIDSISTTALLLAEKKLNVAPGTIGESQNSITTSSIAALQPTTLEANIKTAVNTVLNTPASASQLNIDLANMANVVAASVNSGLNTDQFLSGTATGSLGTTQYTLVNGVAAPNTVASLTSTDAQSALSTAATSDTPPVPALNSITGVWRATNGTAFSYLVLFDDNTFLYGEKTSTPRVIQPYIYNGTDVTENGLEAGTYTYDGQNITFNVTFDENQPAENTPTGIIYHDSGIGDIGKPSVISATLSADGKTLTSAGGALVLNRAAFNPTSIVGAWRSVNGAAFSYLILFDDNTFLYGENDLSAQNRVEIGTFIDNDADSTNNSGFGGYISGGLILFNAVYTDFTENGLEAGTYTYDGTNITFNLVYDDNQPAENTPNGIIYHDSGIGDIGKPSVIPATLSADGNTLTAAGGQLVLRRAF